MKKIKLSKTQILKTIKTIGKYSIVLLSKKSTWLAIGAAGSFIFGYHLDENGNLIADPDGQSNVDVILHGIEVISCALLDGCY
ncbi:TPA: hypothetical protein ACPY5B_003462 [Yersinia enterocolitica]|uniref:hypothetical protein n=1 Tax=Yersinia enterocolitica TaxID=630 RepID=UPI0028643212|nr:hypothetical protein [Yersinia enterocolitica]HDL7947580.1 hypothetical protein [Yersinia enterocolitica]HDL8237171.1 hypothetical protein [Yersinia enterocolitica]HDV5957309.1 hypothetical protein [Yersinia enterocolitica]HEA9985934.1 hypothetical protein [Yersinia enterocolitica]